MANHAYVKTRKVMKPEQISALIERLNRDVFKGVVQIEYTHHEDNKEFWGRDVWYLTAWVDGVNYMQRVCWLNTSRSFEMRHAGGGAFAWWVDLVICNEVALLFNGRWTDDGTGNEAYKPEPDYCRKFSESAVRQSLQLENDPKKRRVEILWNIQQAEETAPPQFRRKWRYLIKLGTRGKDFILSAVKQNPKKAVA